MVASNPSAAGPSLAGAVLSRRWRLVEKIGDGGMGEVYAAEPVDAAGPRVAIKVLHEEFLGDREVLNRFLEEGQVCTRLIHPNIARMLECASAEDGSPYLVMELLEGVPLSAYTQNGGRIPLAQAAPILQGILAGLAAAHAQGVVHRDLKPDNVFLTRGVGGTFAAKVLDFGIAKVIDVAGGMGARTRTGALLGTPAYMSPEQIKSARDVDVRTDLWAAGVMFYEMLTGRSAFPAPTEYARLTAVLTSDPEAIERVDPSLAALGPFVGRALRKDRAERFPTALEMARALAAAVPHAPAPLDGAMQRAGDAPHAPLSQLPPVPSAFMPPMGGGVPTTSPMGPHTAAPVPERTGGTLASAAGRTVEDPVPEVVVAPQPGSTGGTLPSNGLPVIDRAGRGVAVWLVVLMVLAALGAGFTLGWAMARMQ